MRLILALAVFVLFLSLLMNLESRRLAQIKVDNTSPHGEMDVLIFSRGEGLASLEGVNIKEALYDSIIVGDRIFKQKEEAFWIPEKVSPGLRMATFTPEFRIKEYRNFDFSSSASEVSAFVRHCASQSEDTIAVMNVFGTLQLPAGVDGRLVEEVEAAFEKLGVRARPFLDPVASWAMICVRRPQGWVPLSETYSTQRAVKLAFALQSNLAVYDEHQHELARYD